MNYQEAIEQAYSEIKLIKDQGKLASYIPELLNVDPDKFGVHISTVDGFKYGIGNYTDSFSTQSIAKVFSLCLAYKILGEQLWNRLGVEPSGTGFNSLVQLEKDNGVPRNPFINAGAMVICDVLISQFDNPQKALIDFIENLSPNKNIQFSEKLSSSEKSIGYRNVALCSFVKSFGKIENDPNEVLDFYFDLCSFELSCAELTDLFLFLANNGKTIHNGEQILTRSKSKRINALMQTCGFYDESGEFAFKVGLPGKSGVGGGIIAIHPNLYSIAVWSPKLNEKGNSFKGMRFLEKFTTLSGASIF